MESWTRCGTAETSATPVPSLQVVLDLAVTNPASVLTSSIEKIRQVAIEYLTLLLTNQAAQSEVKLTFQQLLCIVGFHDDRDPEMHDLLSLTKEELVSRIGMITETELQQITESFKAICSSSSYADDALSKLYQHLLTRGSKC